MAVIQILLDDSGDVIGSQRKPVSTATRIFFSILETSSQSGAPEWFDPLPQQPLIDRVLRSPKLTAEQKNEIVLQINTKELGDTLQLHTVQPGEVVPPALGDDTRPPARTLVMVYVDP